MTLKIALLGLALVAAWLVLFRPSLRPSRRPPRRAGGPAAPTMAMERCPRCGVYRLPGGRCACGAAPAGED